MTTSKYKDMTSSSYNTRTAFSEHSLYMVVFKTNTVLYDKSHISVQESKQIFKDIVKQLLSREKHQPSAIVHLKVLQTLVLRNMTRMHKSATILPRPS